VERIVASLTGGDAPPPPVVSDQPES